MNRNKAEMKKEAAKIRLLTAATAIFIAICLLLSGLGGRLSGNTKKAGWKNEKSETVQGKADGSGKNKGDKSNEEEVGPIKINVIGVGDNLVHKPCFESSEKFGYDVFYEDFKPSRTADLAILNQETPFVSDKSQVSFYPCFGTVTGFGEATIKAGFDVFSCATNHTYDHGEEGVLTSCEFWDSHPEVTYVGIHSNPEDAGKIKVVDCKGIKIAFLNFATQLNGFKLPEGKEYLIDLLTDSTKDKVAAKIEEAKKISDITIVSVHWGEEYTHKPVSSEVEWAHFFAECGVEIVLGTHPHVVQPVKEYESASSRIGKTIVYYSLGNFMSNQLEVNTNICGMADMDIVKEDGKISVTSYSLDETVCHCFNDPSTGEKRYSTYHIDDYTEELCSKNTKFSGCSLQKIKDMFADAISQYPNEG